MFSNANVYVGVISAVEGVSSTKVTSFFFTRGTSNILPRPNTLAGQAEADIVIVHGEQGIQGDYWSVGSSDVKWEAKDCGIWAGAAAFRICIKESPDYNDTLVAGTVHPC